MIDYATKQDVQAVAKDVQAVAKELREEIAPIKVQYRDILVQNEQIHAKLDVMLEILRDVPDVKARLTRVEETVEAEQAKTELNRYHLNELRRDVDAHGRRPHRAS